jgi:glutathione S-transferase
MKLLYTKTSPYARKVRIVAAEKRISLDLHEVVLADPQNAVPDYNPLGKIPVLLLDDGEPLYDSSVIVDYLEQRTPVARILPQDTRARFQVKRWEALADGVCDSGVSIMLEKRRAEHLQDAAWIEKQQLKMARGLQRMEDDLGERDFCVGESMTLADIALGCVLGYLTLRYPELNFKKQYPNLAKHYQRMMERESFKDTAPPQA